MILVQIHKIKYHIISFVDRYCFSNCEQNKKFLSKILEEFLKKHSMFSILQCINQFNNLDLYMCTKSGTDRFKILDSTHSKWLINDEVSDDDLNYEILNPSLPLTYIRIIAYFLEDEEL